MECRELSLTVSKLSLDAFLALLSVLLQYLVVLAHHIMELACEDIVLQENRHRRVITNATSSNHIPTGSNTWVFLIRKSAVFLAGPCSSAAISSFRSKQQHVFINKTG